MSLKYNQYADLLNLSLSTASYGHFGGKIRSSCRNREAEK